MCKRLGPVRVRHSKYPLLLLLLLKPVCKRLGPVRVRRSKYPLLLLKPMCKRLGPVRVRRSKYPLLLLLLLSSGAAAKKCSFNGVTSYDRGWKKGAEKRHLESGSATSIA